MSILTQNCHFEQNDDTVYIWLKIPRNIMSILLQNCHFGRSNDIFKILMDILRKNISLPQNCHFEGSNDIDLYPRQIQ